VHLPDGPCLGLCGRPLPDGSHFYRHGRCATPCHQRAMIATRFYVWLVEGHRWREITKTEKSAENVALRSAAQGTLRQEADGAAREGPAVLATGRRSLARRQAWSSPRGLGTRD